PALELGRAVLAAERQVALAHAPERPKRPLPGPLAGVRSLVGGDGRPVDAHARACDLEPMRAGKHLAEAGDEGGPVPVLGPAGARGDAGLTAEEIGDDALGAVLTDRGVPALLE